MIDEKLTKECLVVQQWTLSSGKYRHHRPDPLKILRRDAFSSLKGRKGKELKLISNLENVRGRERGKFDWDNKNRERERERERETRIGKKTTNLAIVEREGVRLEDFHVSHLFVAASWPMVGRERIVSVSGRVKPGEMQPPTTIPFEWDSLL